MKKRTGARAVRRVQSIEWPTVALIVVCYAGWALALFWVAPRLPGMAVIIAGFAIALHASLIHEVLHGHPTPLIWLNELIMRLPLNLLYPYCRFRDLHLAHHRDSRLTDPYDDPESNYLDPEVWNRLAGGQRLLLRVNNTLAGRMIVGPLVGTWAFLRSEMKLVRKGDLRVVAAWGLHLIGVALVMWIVARSPMSIWGYFGAVYLGIAVLKVRTFLEHQAHEKARGRTVIVEDRGPLAFLFLNNNLHVVHHMHPNVAWYQLPALYRAGRDRFLAYNDGYVYRSYGEVFRRYLLRTKDPVAHPLWRRE
ncbi:fatty acid desaturase [Seohaeicola nanhaiensis]|uniref:Fatty acid desaturase n=1 Tax=Seohaeicola nanhaiensis TaxID=1387282 RepID=A0ABV9KJG8_9RHOB